MGIGTISVYEMFHTFENKAVMMTSNMVMVMFPFITCRICMSLYSYGIKITIVTRHFWEY